MTKYPMALMITSALALLSALIAVPPLPLGSSARLLAATITEAPERRIALVIGNMAYQENPRRTSVHDAVDMAATLGQLGFQVAELHNATKQRMDDAIAQFTQQLNSGGVGVFYFSGQGVGVHGYNFLIPVDARLSRETDLEGQAIRLDGVLDHLQQAGNGLNFIILDASRRNPFAHGGRSDLPPQVALQAHSGVLIAYATSPGMAVENGPGRSSMYTTHLLYFLKMPGLTAEQLFKEVRVAVARETGRRQIPWVSISIPGGFFFSGR